MTKIYLIRHAEAEGNLYRRIHGHYNSLITENGRRQIAALEGRFATIPVDAVYSSDLYRTMTTAQAVYVPQALPLVTRPALREINLGAWEDVPWGEVGHFDPQGLRAFNSTSPDWRAPEGENLLEVQTRVVRELRTIAAAHPGGTVAVVSHGTAIRSTLAFFHSLSIGESGQLGHSDNTAVSLVELGENFARVVFENDNTHLPEEISTLARQSWWKHKAGAPADANLWFCPLELAKPEDAALFREARREAWADIRGDMTGYDGEGFFRDAQAACTQDPRSVMCAMLGDRPAGVIHMDTARHQAQGAGYIPFVYMLPQYRKRGLGVQLLGQAVAIYRPLGRRTLLLRCAPDNQVAQRFYKRYGFRKIGEAAGTRVPLDLLEKYIGY